MRRRVLVAVGLAGVLATLAVIGVSGLVRMSRLHAEIEAIERDVAELQRRGGALGQQIECLRNDPACIEAYAREHMGMVAPGDRVLKFPSTGSRPGTPPAERRP